MSEEDVERGYRDAMFNMARLNRTAGNLMNMYGAHGATEVAGLLLTSINVICTGGLEVLQLV